MINHWNTYTSWGTVEPPFKPTENVVKQYADIIDNPDYLLLLGCTKELIPLGKHTTAYDNCLTRLGLFPGHSVEIDWLEMQKSEYNYNAITGDASLNCISFLDWEEVIRRCKIITSGPIVFRVYENYLTPKTLASIRSGIKEKTIPSFDCLKLELFFYLAKDNPDVITSEIIKLFYSLFKSKEDLQALTGWDINTINAIDTYVDSDTIYCFPTEIQIKSKFPEIKRIPSQGYPMSEHCPFYNFV